MNLDASAYHSVGGGPCVDTVEPHVRRVRWWLRKTTQVGSVCRGRGSDVEGGN